MDSLIKVEIAVQAHAENSVHNHVNFNLFIKYENLSIGNISGTKYFNKRTWINKNQSKSVSLKV